MVILITGASRGIGAELAMELAKEKHTVLLVSRDQNKIQHISDECNRISGVECAHTLPFDINDLDHNGDGIRALVRKYAEKIDVIVNNAGHVVRKPFEEITPSEVSTMFRANLYAPGNLVRILLPFLRKSEHAHVVNITSMGGFQGSVKFKGLSYYSASKAALAVLTECLAEEFSKEGISFNALAPGAVQTEMLEEAFPGYTAPLKAGEMAGFIKWFALNGHKFFNGKHLPVSLSTP